MRSYKAPRSTDTRRASVSPPRRLMVGAITATLTLVAGCGAVAKNSGSGESGKSSGSSSQSNVVALLMSDNTTSRWFEVDVPNITKSLKELSPETKVLNYNGANSPDTQLSQARTAIGQGAKVLIVTSVDPKSAGAIVKLAHDNGAKVIAYVHQIVDAPIDYFVGFDPIALGQQEGKWMAENTKQGDGIVLINGWTATSLAHEFRKGYMKELQPLFKDGSRALIGETFTEQWLASNAQSEMDAFLSKSPKGVNAVLVENDQMAGGVVASLNGAGLAGKVRVTGLDAEPAALKRILQGTQSMTIYPGFKREAEHAAQIAAAIVAGKEPAADIFNGKTVNMGAGEVPWAVTETTAVTVDNMAVVIDEGYITKDKLCGGMAAVGPCK